MLFTNRENRNLAYVAYIWVFYVYNILYNWRRKKEISNCINLQVKKKKRQRFRSTVIIKNYISICYAI